MGVDLRTEVAADDVGVDHGLAHTPSTSATWIDKAPTGTVDILFISEGSSALAANRR